MFVEWIYLLYGELENFWGYYKQKNTGGGDIWMKKVILDKENLGKYNGN